METDEIIHDAIGEGDSWKGAAISGSIDAYAARIRRAGFSPFAVIEPFADVG